MGGQLRAPGVQSLLKQLARKANNDENLGFCLITTREPLTDLTEFQRRSQSSLGSVLHVDLGNLTDEAGAALLHHAGANRSGPAEINPNDNEIISASREVNGHALTLNLLGRFLARAHGGDIRRRDLVKLEEADHKEPGGTTFKMLAAFENWFARDGDIEARSLSILRLLGLFDRPANSDCMAALREPPVIAGLTDHLFTARRDAVSGTWTIQGLSEQSWNSGISFLKDFGLVNIHEISDEHERLIDCHALIREFFGRRIESTCPIGFSTAHLRLYKYLKHSTAQHRISAEFNHWPSASLPSCKTWSLGKHSSGS